ncbi:bifunctional folylpolyglutamate synthase/dihydrofolate synthase [Metabacillus malikii]|uniref:tetrahydrofolate synthase n=1 Tax=Metabacillus malikii TaxID=1504265 RepID=A0ABT9ZKL2_9BACI|nr:folylpolyglutamate synthase/dihydrofolate synthase family protein [Metabacillus malikii]MDQ0232808.1 dihydrofolate synthase/folylpolyglutamate synthase [Metabacillus malikii]
MFTNYEAAVDWIHSRLKFGVKPGLKRMEWLLEKFHHPEQKLQVIHVAGTNGKGSTVAYMRHILQEAGYKVGTFTSPYIETFNERISINGEPISANDMLKLVNEIKPFVDKIEETELGGPTEFEIITTMMYVYFGKYNKPDFLLLETGLGGRLDSTNIIEKPILSLITNVGYDHMNILGDTIEEIAAEKAGIIKDSVPVFTTAENRAALQVITEVANTKNAPIHRYADEMKILDHQSFEDGEKFSIQTSHRTYEDLFISMMGEHQTKNALLAVAAMDYLIQTGIAHITEQQIRKGLKHTMWKGRFEKVLTNPEVIIDGAHNIEGIESLVKTLERHYNNREIHFLVSVLEDKDYAAMISKLASVATSMHFTTFDFPRATPSYKLYSVCSIENKTFHDDWQDILLELLNSYENNDNSLIIIVGSLYFISLVRGYLLN